MICDCDHYIFENGTTNCYIALDQGVFIDFVLERLTVTLCHEHGIFHVVFHTFSKHLLSLSSYLVLIISTRPRSFYPFRLLTMFQTSRKIEDAMY